MLGDSFCKTTTNALRTWLRFTTFNPHAWGLFLQGSPRKRQRGCRERLSIPMLGDSFCKQAFRCRGKGGKGSFNPHAWGLFLQVDVNQPAWITTGNYHYLSIPMLGDSFCKSTCCVLRKPLSRVTFNPHAWGLFLQDVYDRLRT